MAVHKKKEEKKDEGKEAASAEPKEEVIVSDVVTKTTERIEVVEEVDPLNDFKEKMSEEEQIPTPAPEKKNYMWPILFIFVVGIVFLAGIFVYKNGMFKSEKVNVVTVTPAPTAIPEPTIAPDLSKYEIKVLNGSEVSGEAGRQQTNLENEGFTVSSVGNADKSDYTTTIIQAKKTVDKAFLDKLKSVLETSFVLGDQEELSDDSSSDVIVIIGSETN